MGLDIEEDLKRKVIELSLAAGKRRQKEQTNFVHLHYGSLPEGAHDTIPLLENFCFILALLRSRSSDHVLEAKALLERLLAFEVEGNFPIYLHEYPQCKDRDLSIQILPVLHWILIDFQAVLGERLQVQIDLLISRIVVHGFKIHQERPLAAASACKLKAFAEPHGEINWIPRTAEEWGDYLIALQMAGSLGRNIEKEVALAASQWSLDFSVFLGAQSQEGKEPQLTLFDLFMSSYSQKFTQRTLSDHFIHCQASLVQKFDVRPCHIEGKPWDALLTNDPRQPYLLFWNGEEALHTLTCGSKKVEIVTELLDKGARLTFHLLQLPLENEDRHEVALYCDLHPDHQLFVEGEKATGFHCGEEVSILSLERTIRMRFSVVSGEGEFFGQISQGNRLSQVSCKGARLYDAFDWKISLRTLRRSEPCAVCVELLID